MHVHHDAMNHTDLHLNQLRLVEALWRTGHLSEAASEVGITQPAASHALARLRRQLQDPIFVRTSEGMRPTPFGSRLSTSVREALQMLRSGLERREFEPSTSTRAFNVFMTGVGQMLFLPRVLQRLAVEAPGVTLRVRHVPAKAPHLLLESGEVDLAIGAFTTLISGCRQRRLFRESFVCVVRRDHPAFVNGMTAEAFQSVPHALAEPTGYVEDLLDQWLSRQKARRVVKLHVPYFLALPHVIAQSNLLAFMSNRVAEAYAKLLPLKIMQPPTKLPTYDSKLFWHERFHQDPANRWLRQMFIELFSE
jgi:DNA-binding transcriptional LysR family regulator